MEEENGQEEERCRRRREEKSKGEEGPAELRASSLRESKGPS